MKGLTQSGLLADVEDPGGLERSYRRGGECATGDDGAEREVRRHGVRMLEFGAARAVLTRC